MEDGDVGIYSVYISLPFPSPVDYHSLAGQKKIDGLDSLLPTGRGLVDGLVDSRNDDMRRNINR